MGINRAKGLSLIRYFQNNAAGLDYYKLLNKTAYPDPARLPETTTPIQSNYIWKVHVLGYDEDRGVNVNFWQTISSDQPITKQQAESAYYSAYLDSETDRYLTLNSFNAEEAYRNIAVAATL